MQLTENQRKAIDSFIEEIGKMQKFQGVASMGKDTSKREIHYRAYCNIGKGGRGWGCLQQGMTGILRVVVWYQNIHKPNSREWRPSIIIKAVVEHLKI